MLGLIPNGAGEFCGGLIFIRHTLKGDGCAATVYIPGLAKPHKLPQNEKSAGLKSKMEDFCQGSSLGHLLGAMSDPPPSTISTA